MKQPKIVPVADDHIEIDLSKIKPTRNSKNSR